MTSVLLAEDDPSISEPLARALRREGYEVGVSADGPGALEAARGGGHDLIVLDIGLPELDGLEVCRLIRSEGQSVPVLILTARADEVDTVIGLDAGADDYVTKPFRFEELDLRVAKTLRRAQATVQETREHLGGAGLRGDLSQVGLSSLLILIEMERKTGLLQLRAPNGPSAQVLVRDGKVVHARLDDSEEPVDAECVYYLLTWGAGEFEFVMCLVEGADRVNVSTTHLLMEGARLMDESREPSPDQPIATIPPLSPVGDPTNDDVL
jgi:CheY-like chemotaxis protein